MPRGPQTLGWRHGRKWSLGRALRGMFVKPTIDETTWEDLETALITADFGPDITERIVDELREKVERYRTTDPRDLQRMLKETLEEHFAKFDTTLRLTERPAVVLVVGVNGVGKTTTIGKFAKFLQRYGRSVVVGAADTFRAAAVDQLATWAERGGAAIVRPQQEGQDPASVAFQTIEYAKRTGTEIVLVDTAGRLHTKGGLMDELGKIRRVIEKQAPISEVLLVLDATTGQNGVMQAQAFLEHAGRHRSRAHEARRVGQGRIRARRAGAHRHPGEAARAGRGNRRPDRLHAARVRGIPRRLSSSI